MNLRFAVAAAAVAFAPIAVVGAQSAPASGDSSERKTCENDSTIGTRLVNTRRCRTKAERDAHKAEARGTVDRIQLMKQTFRRCPPDCL